MDETRKNEIATPPIAGRFRALEIAVELFKECEKVRCSLHLKDQLHRASSSITLNLAEGSAKPTMADRLKFYYIAFGSLRECQGIFRLIDVQAGSALWSLSDQLGANLFRLCQALENPKRKTK